MSSGKGRSRGRKKVSQAQLIGNLCSEKNQCLVTNVPVKKVNQAQFMDYNERKENIKHNNFLLFEDKKAEQNIEKRVEKLDLNAISSEINHQTNNSNNSSKQFVAVVDDKEKSYSSDSSTSGDLVITPTKPSQNGKLVKARKPKEYGKCFRKEIAIVTNFYRISSKKQDVFHYDIEIISSYGKMHTNNIKPLNKELSRHVVFELLKLNEGLEQYTPIFDGKKNLFTAKRFPFNDETEFEVPLQSEGKRKTFWVTIKPVKKKNSDNFIQASLLDSYAQGKLENFPEQIRLVYEAIFSHRKWNSSQIRCGMSFFSLQQRKYPLGDGLELLQGYNQNIRFTEIGPTIVINVATSTFHKSGPLIDYIADILRKPINHGSFLTNTEINKLNKTICGIRIEVSHGKFKRKYYIQKITKILARDLKFTDTKTERTVSVEDYFQDTYGKPLQYNKLPLVEMRKKDVYLPFEVCNVPPGQRFPSKTLEGRKKTMMIKYAAISPNQKFDKIQSYAKDVSSISESTMTNYGLDMNLEPVSFLTRVLQQPEIKYSSSVVKPNDQGEWEMHQNYLDPAEVKNWMIINFVDRLDDKVLDKLRNLLYRAGSRVGLCLKNPIIKSYSTNSLEDVLTHAKEKGMQFVVIVTSKYLDSDLYYKIKYICDIKLGLICQCVDESLISDYKKFNEKSAADICLKINTKLEGVNHTLSEWPLALEKEAVLIIGADVVHSADLECSSIAAVVGCVDYNTWKYAVSCRALTNPKENGLNQEIILTLKEMMVIILKAYYKNTRRKPGKILFYRDGISEGQFQKALETEIPMIKDACQSLQQDVYQPPITFVIVQKRVQPRFKPKLENDGVGKMKNLPSGTIIDKHVVDPINYDFYLISHEGIQGTTKPIYYTILFDENRVEPDVIQKLSFYLCHVNARCNRSISIPAPIKYADLLAYRAMNYVKALKSQPNQKRCSQSNSTIPKNITDLLKRIETIKNKMFFV